MKIGILGINVPRETVTAIESQASLYECSFNNYSQTEELLEAVQQNLAIRVVVINIDVNPIEKFKLCIKIKQISSAHILFLSKCTDPDERVRWFSYGAEGYITIPFRAEELLRVSRQFVESEVTHKLTDENFHIDLRTRTVIYKGKKIKFTPKLFDLLLYLVENEGKLVTREDIMENVCKSSDYLSNRNISTLVKQIRKQTEYDIVRTVRGKGYIYSSGNKY